MSQNSRVTREDKHLEEVVRDILQTATLQCTSADSTKRPVILRWKQSMKMAIIMNIINSLNAELNLTCHLLILLEDLKFMGPCIVSIFQYTSNKMQRYTVY
jgi:hypothetical protein